MPAGRLVDRARSPSGGQVPAGRLVDPGNKSLVICRDEQGKLHSTVSSLKDENVIAKAELRGTLVTLNINMKKKDEAENFVSEVADTFKTKWGMSKGTIIEYTIIGNDESYKIKYKDIKPVEATATTAATASAASAADKTKKTVAKTNKKK